MVVVTFGWLELPLPSRTSGDLLDLPVPLAFVLAVQLVSVLQSGIQMADTKLNVPPFHEDFRVIQIL